MLLAVFLEVISLLLGDIVNVIVVEIVQEVKLRIFLYFGLVVCRDHAIAGIPVGFADDGLHTDWNAPVFEH